MQEAGAPRRYSFRAHLAAFGLVVTFPMAALAAFLLLHSADVARSQADARLSQLAASASANFDREMERHLLVLNTLSTLPSFGADWLTFYDRASRSLRGEGYIIVSDRSLRQLVNTYVPYGRQPARTGDVETAQRVIETRRAQASDVFTSLVTSGHVVNFDLPIVRNGEVAYILMYGRTVEHLRGILQAQALDAGWRSALFDRHGRPIASLAGTAGMAPARLTPSVNGLSRYTDANGAAFLRAAHTSETTGWTVAVDVPLAAVNREINETLQLWMLFALAAVASAIGLGVVFGHFLSRQLQRAAAYATALGREEATQTIGPTSLREVAAISSALETARAELDRRMGQQRLLSRELNHRVKNLISVVTGVAKMTFSNGAERPQEALLQRLQSLARSQDLLIRSDWTDLPLREIVQMETLPFAERVSIEGPEVQVTAGKVQTFALLLHELTTNAVKYGALRDGDGAVDVGWSTGADRFVFRWKERCGQPPAAMEKPGFGSTLLTRAFGTESRTRFEIEAEGLLYEMSVSLAAITGKRV